MCLKITKLILKYFILKVYILNIIYVLVLKLKEDMRIPKKRHETKLIIYYYYYFKGA